MTVNTIIALPEDTLYEIAKYVGEPPLLEPISKAFVALSEETYKHLWKCLRSNFLKMHPIAVASTKVTALECNACGALILS